MLANNPSLRPNQASLRFLGQSGFFLEGSGKTLLIDPYLSDSAGRDAPLFTRIYPPPVRPEKVRADFFLVTHDHLDHLDPDTVAAYAYKDSTHFVAPRLAAKTLRSLGVPSVTVVDVGERIERDSVIIQGVFALPTGPDVLDTTGYHIALPNGRTVYHTADTAYCPLLLKACPHAEVLLTCINGKFGNLTAEQAADLAQAVNPQIAVPHHYDVMALNSENPETFRYFYDQLSLSGRCAILQPMEELIW